VTEQDGSVSAPGLSPHSDVDDVDGRLVDWRAVVRGGFIALVVLVVISAVEAVLDHNIKDFQDTGWIYPLFVGVLLGYGAGGWIAGRAAPDGALSNGALAGVAGFVAWIPLRIVIWLIRDDHTGLFTGHDPALRPGQLFGHLVIAAGVGMLGGWAAGRMARRTPTQS
jgi:hypothetical protein